MGAARGRAGAAGATAARPRALSPRSPKSPRARRCRAAAEAGIDYAEQALTLADAARPAESPPVRSGFAASARCNLGDRGGLDDFREAIALATEAGQGREVAAAAQLLAISLWPFEGPGAALDVLQAGIAFARARGLTEIAEAAHANMLDLLVETGEPEQALDLAAELAERLRSQRQPAQPRRGASHVRRGS